MTVTQVCAIATIFVNAADSMCRLRSKIRPSPVVEEEFPEEIKRPASTEDGSSTVLGGDTPQTTSALYGINSYYTSRGFVCLFLIFAIRKASQYWNSESSKSTVENSFQSPLMQQGES